MEEQYFTGEIRCFPYIFIPAGWAICLGQSLPRQHYQNLYAIIGNIYGGDAAAGTFALPNLIGNVAICADNNNNTGFPNRSIGHTGGTEQETLTQEQIPAHSHPVSVAVGGTMQMPISQFVGDTDSPNGSVLAIPQDHTNIYSISPDASMAPQSANVSGNVDILYPSGAIGMPHTNMQPTMALTYCICLNGEFPVRPL